LDNGIIEEPNALARFQDYCVKKCVSRTVNLSNFMLKDHAFVELSNIIWNTQAIGRLIISENQLRETVVTAFADALKRNNSICALDVCQSFLTPQGFHCLFTALIENESVVSISAGNPGSTNRNILGAVGTQALAFLLSKS
jgi:hypothetical protein